MVEIYFDVVSTWWFIGFLILVGVFYGVQAQFELPKPKVQKLGLRYRLRDYYVGVFFAIAVCLLTGAYWMYLNDIIWSVYAMVRRLRALADAPTGDDIAAATLAFTLLRMWINERTTSATEEGLITDRINAAVASLGADKEVLTDAGATTRPNIAVRVGAILALERLAKQNRDVHCQIMEILCSCVREETSGSADYETRHAEKPREDIQIALTVIGRRSKRQISIEPAGLIDLRGAYLVGADLRGAYLSKARLQDVKLNRADLTLAKLNNAELVGTTLNEAYLNKAQMNAADLKLAQLSGAELISVDFNEAKLVSARIDGSLLYFNAIRRGACLMNVNFSEVVINRERLQEMFGDASVTLPVELQPPPAHWPTVALRWWDFYAEWDKWRNDPDGYVFEPKQYEDKYRDQMGA